MDVRIHLESCSPPIGDAEAPGRGQAQQFVGWLDLLRVLASIFGDETGPSGTGAHDPSDLPIRPTST